VVVAKNKFLLVNRPDVCQQNRFSALMTAFYSNHKVV